MYKRLIVVTLAASALCCAQEASLGDVARQQRATPKPHARRVIDNENLPHASPAEAMNGAVIGGAPLESELAKPPVNAGADAKKALEHLNGAEQSEKDAVAKFQEQLRDGNLSDESRQMLQESLEKAKEALAHFAEQRAQLAQAPSASDASANATSGDATPADAAQTSQAKSDNQADNKNENSKPEPSADKSAD